MTLPVEYESFERYFSEAVDFLNQYQFLYNYPNTNILTEDVFTRLTYNFGDNILGDVEAFECGDLSHVENANLQDFFRVLNKLKPLEECEDIEDMKNDAGYRNIPLSPKKFHEILRLSEKVKEICLETRTGAVVELGSGLGYLSQMLHSQYKLKVIGMEAKQVFIQNAVRRQKKFHEDSLNEVVFHCHVVSSNSDEEIENVLEETFGQSNTPFCLVGLHACADLTVDAIRLFCKMSNALSLVIMPCCYHKMSMPLDHRQTVPGRECFHNVPLSTVFKKIWREREGDMIIRRPFLRLAAQPHNQCCQLDSVAFNLLSRAFLRYFCTEYGLIETRRKRRPVCKENINKMDLKTYFREAVEHGYKFQIERENLKVLPAAEDLLKSWTDRSQPRWSDLAKALVILQNLLQPICENLIMLDRLAFIHECGFKDADFVRVTDAKISPRCWALVVKKNTVSK